MLNKNKKIENVVKFSLTIIIFYDIFLLLKKAKFSKENGAKLKGLNRKAA